MCFAHLKCQSLTGWSSLILILAIASAPETRLQLARTEVT